MGILRAILLAACCLAASPAAAAGCAGGWEKALSDLKQPSTEPNLRSSQAQCLIKYYLDNAAVTQAALKVIRDPREDVLLREDLIQAFAAATLRKNVKVEGELSPELDQQDRAALSATASGAQDLLALTRAVKSMNEVVAVTRHESEFLRAFSEIALEDANPVLLRAAAVSALEEVSRKSFESGLYDARGLRIAQEALQIVANRDDNGSYFTGASLAYGRMAKAGIPSYSPALPKPGRALASEKTK